MAKNDAAIPQTYLDTIKANAFKVDPFLLRIESVDFPATANMAPGELDRLQAPLDELMVESICRFGVLKHILARKDGDSFIVVDGRRRVMHARAASLRLQALGKEAIRVPVSVVRGEEIQLFGLARIANSFNLIDPPITNAKNAQWMIDHGASVDEVALHFGVKPVTIADWLKLLDLAPEIQAQVQGKTLTTNAGLALAELSMADQVKAMESAKVTAATSGGKLTTAHVQAAASQTKVQNGGNAPKATPKERVSKALDVLGSMALLVATGKIDLSKPSASADQILATLKRVTLILGDRKFDSLVKSLAPKEDEATE